MVHKVFIQSAENQINSWTLINLNPPKKIGQRRVCCTAAAAARGETPTAIVSAVAADRTWNAAARWQLELQQLGEKYNGLLQSSMEEDHPLQVSSDSQNEKSLVLERIVCCNLPACVQSSHCIYFLLKNSAADLICLSVKSATAAHGGHWPEF